MQMAIVGFRKPSGGNQNTASVSFETFKGAETAYYVIYGFWNLQGSKSGSLTDTTAPPVKTFDIKY